ncbi:MAG: glutamate 5-kinase [Micropepsaceae bacterium]
MSAKLTSARTLVVKIGSSTLVDATTGALSGEWLAAFAADVARVKARGQQVVLVSSGAIALGRRQLKLAPGVLKLEEAQAAAAVGQISLARAWSEALAGHGLAVAQVLLTLGDTENRRRYLNARSTLKTLLSLGAVPVINENDTVATAEIRFGDNDRLAARVTGMIEADCLVLLSDIDGLYASDPRVDAQARFIAEVAVITPEIDAMAGVSGSDMGSGGMATKLMAARIATEAGANMAIANGALRPPLKAIEDGARCTWFLAQATPAAARKRWIGGSLKPAGSITIDAGAANALGQGKSLLPAGVIAVDGAFERGDCVAVKDLTGREIGRGLIAYGADDARRICRVKSGEIETILGYRGRAEIIHRDDMALMRT